MLPKLSPTAKNQARGAEIEDRGSVIEEMYSYMQHRLHFRSQLLALCLALGQLHLTEYG